MKTIKSIVKQALGIAEVEKRDGVYISRPVLNGQEWYDWAVKWGVPSPIAAADMHVTVMSSTVDVKMVPDKSAYSVPTSGGWSPGCFCLMGPQNQALVFCWDDYDLWDRHYAFIRNGAVDSWPTYRPHMTITMENGDYELPDGALSDAPTFISLGGEVYADLKKATPDDEESDGAAGDDAEDGDDALIIVIEIAAAAAQKALDVEQNLSPLDRLALRDMAVRKTVTKGVLKRVSAADWAPAEIKDLAKSVTKPVAVAATKKRVEVDVTITTHQIGSDVEKTSKASALTMKADDDRHLVWGIASVSTVKGELYVDLHDERITTRCLEEFTIDLMKNQRAGKFEHEGEVCNHVVQALVLSDDLQKALGIDLGKECLVTCTEVPNDADWALVKQGNWEQSIAGRLWYYEDE